MSIMIGISVLVNFVFLVKSELFFVGSVSFVVTARVLSGSIYERISTAISRYPHPLLRKSRIIAFAHEAVTFSKDVWNSWAVRSPKNATSIYHTSENAHVNIFSEVDGITIVSRTTSAESGVVLSHLV